LQTNQTSYELPDGQSTKKLKNIKPRILLKTLTRQFLSS
jgi:hypothetical protein